MVIAHNTAYVITAGDISTVVNIGNETCIYTCNTTNAVGSNITIAVFTMSNTSIISSIDTTITIETSNAA